jgi:hypothetical protein
VGVLRLVEQPEHELRGMQPQRAPDHRVGDLGALEQQRRRQRAACRNHRVGVYPMTRSGAVDVLDARRLGPASAVLDHDPLDVRVRSQRQRSGREGALDVGVRRGLARVGRAALQARPALTAVLVGVHRHRLKRGPDGVKPALGGLHAPLGVPIGSQPDAKVALDTVVVRVEVGARDRLAALVAQPGGRVPLIELALARAKCHLGVDRGAAADAAAADQDDRTESGIADRERESNRPPEVVGGSRLPPDELLGLVVAAGLEQQHRATAGRKLTSDDAAARARAHDNDLKALVHSLTPMNDQSLAIRIASGEWKSISS